MSNIYPILYKIVITIALFYGLLFLFVSFIDHEGNVFPKWLNKIINILKIKYNQFTFLYFIKIQKYKHMFSPLSRPKGREIFNSFLFSLKAKELYRKIKLFPLRLYNYVNHNYIQLSIDPFVSQLTKNSYIHIDVYNIHQLDHKDLFRAIYIEIMSNTEIYSKLEEYKISLIGTSFSDSLWREYNIAKIYDINLNLHINKNLSFEEFYFSILNQYFRLNEIQDLDNIYRLEIRMRKF